MSQGKSTVQNVTSSKENIKVGVASSWDLSTVPCFIDILEANALGLLNIIPYL